MNVTVDVTDPVELYAAGVRALNTALGSNGARAFMKQCFGGRGDYTKEKYECSDLTPDEFAAMAEEAKTEAEAVGAWE
jgi:hypothetical protein